VRPGKSGDEHCRRLLVPSVVITPQALKSYRFLGAEFSLPNGTGSQAIGVCPFCGKEKKWYAHVKTGLWDCKSCGETGNSVEFLRRLHDISGGDSRAFARLAQERTFLSPDTLVKWGVVQSALSGDWLVPGYNVGGRLDQLYRYTKVRDDKDPSRWNNLLLPTPGIWSEGESHRLFGPFGDDSHPSGFDPGKNDVFLCEGPWDGMSLWETLRLCCREDGEEDNSLDGVSPIVPCEGEADSLLSSVNVVATPGANVFPESFCPLFSGKRVFLMFDNDHPREFPPGSGRMVDGAGLAGMKRVAALLAAQKEPPTSIHYLRWGIPEKEGGSTPEGYYDPSLPSGYDVRDFLSEADTVEGRAVRLSQLLERVHEVPEEWTKQEDKSKPEPLKCLPCYDWATLQSVCRKAMKWTPGLDRATSVALAVVVSTDCIGDQLWVKFMSPPSTGKTSICEALAVATQYVKSVSTLTGLHSGYRSDRKGSTDHSLIPQMAGKSLVVKDADTLLKAPNREQILSQLRDLYDTTSRAYYRHGVSRDYENIRSTIMLFGTGSLRELDASDLGARFLDCTIMDTIDDELEDDISGRVAYRALRNLAVMSNGKAEERTTPEMTLMKQLMGGYVTYLRKNAASLLARVTASDENVEKCRNLAKFVSYMRARPSHKQQEVVERELSARLVEQLVRLMGCLSAVLGRWTVDDEIIRRVEQVAMDTARGRTLEITRCLYGAGAPGMEKSVLAVHTTDTEEKLGYFLQFLRKIGVVRSFVAAGHSRNIRARVRWRLTDRMADLYGSVVDGVEKH
jgi:hypothetical protein